MSILDFMEMNVSGSLFSCLLASLICLSFAGIGEFFLKGRHGIILHSVVGVTFVAAIVTFFAGFCAALCKYIIYVSVFFGAFLTLKSIFQKKRTLSDFYALVPMFIFMGFILYRVFEIITIKDGMFHYNSHQPYFSGIAIEIFRAEYFSRLRIFDAYPYEWSKYHLFPGSSTAIPLLAFAQKNYISHLMAKFVWLAFLGGAVFDCLREKYDLKKSILMFLLGFGLFFMYHNFIWSITTQTFNAVLFYVLLWFMFDFGTARAGGGQMLFSLALAFSKGGSALTGGCLFLLSLYNVLSAEKFQFIQFLKMKYDGKYSFSFIVSLKQKYFSWSQFFKKNKFEIIAVFVLGLTVLSMVLFGKNAAVASQTKLGVSHIGEFTHHFLNPPWFENMALLRDIIRFLSEKNLNFTFTNQWIFFSAVVYLLIRNRMNCLALFKNHKIFWSCLGVSCVGLFFVFNSVMKNSAYVLSMMFLAYLIPFITLLSSLKKHLVMPFIVAFVGMLTTNFLLYIATSGPNYALMYYWLLLVFIQQFTQDIFSNKKIFQIVFYALLIFGLYQFTFRTPHMYTLGPSDPRDDTLVKLQRIPNLGKKPFEVSSKNQLTLAKLHAAKGNRVHYRFILDEKNIGAPLRSVSQSFHWFLPEGYKAFGYEKIKY